MEFVNSGIVNKRVGLRDSNGLVYPVEGVEDSRTILTMSGSRVGLSIICTKDMSLGGEERTLLPKIKPLTANEKGSDVEGDEESIDVEETELGVGGKEPTGDRGTLSSVVRSIMVPWLGSSDWLGSASDGIEVIMLISVGFGSISTLDVGVDEPTGDRGTKLAIFRCSVAAGVDSMGLGVQV
jgi:hypothetical protein